MWSHPVCMLIMFLPEGYILIDFKLIPSQNNTINLVLITLACLFSGSTLLIHLSADSTIALLLRPSSFVYVSAKLSEAYNVALWEIIDSKVSLSFIMTQKQALKASSAKRQ